MWNLLVSQHRVWILCSSKMLCNGICRCHQRCGGTDSSVFKMLAHSGCPQFWSGQCLVSCWNACVLKNKYKFYVYWTVHLRDSWIKIDKLMSLALFFAQHVSNASTFIFRSLRLCVCGYTALVRCVLALRCGSAGVVWYHASCETMTS